MLWIKYKKPTYVDENGRQCYLTRGITWSEANEEKIKSKGYSYSVVEYEPHVPEWKKKATADDVLDTLLGVSE
jgi:hypothetical protein